MKTASLISISFLFLLGFFRVFKSCSYTDDVVKAGSYTKNLDDAHYLKSYNTSKLHPLVATKLDEITNPQITLQAEKAADEIVFSELAVNKPHLKEKIERLNKFENPLERSQFSNELKKSILSKDQMLHFESVFKSIETGLRIKDLYALEGSAETDQNKMLKDSKSLKISPFTIKIPAHFIEFQTLKHDAIKGIWGNEEITIIIYKTYKKRKEAFEDWKNFKKSKDINLKIFDSTSTVNNYELLSFTPITNYGAKVEAYRKGKMKFLSNKNSFLIIDVEYRNPNLFNQEAEKLIQSF